jgi:dienelactone hydrolase
MATLLLIILLIVEFGFLSYELARSTSKRQWMPRRFIINAVQTVLYLIMVLLPGIDFSFRFRMLFALLVIRLLVAGIFALAYKKNDKIKRKGAMVLSCILSVMLISFNMLPAFLFADYHGRPLTGEYEVKEAQTILIDASRLEEFETDGSYREVPVHFYYPADCDEDGGLPLVIFSHGAFGYYQSNASTYMELASHGYVVVSLDHPYHSFFTNDSDGKLITVDPGFFQTAMYVGGNDNDMSEDEIYEITSEWMDLREADVNFVIDTLEGTDLMSEEWCTGNVAEAVSLMDVSRIGLMGHSLGGATAVTVGRRDDISAVIDIDGTMLGEETGVVDGMPVINDEPYTTPLLVIDNEEHHNSSIEALNTSYPYANNVILEKAAEGYRTYIRGAAHMDLTDLPLFSPFLAGMLNTSESNVDHEACIDTVNELVLNFFDCYLKGEGEFSVNESYL